jgi:hypothetical protein
MDADEVAEAEAAAVRVWIPPVTAAMGTRIWALYAGILFAESESGDEELDATTVVEIATGSYADESAPDDVKAAAVAQKALLDSLRWEEANAVAEAAIYWNVQGGGMDAVNALLKEGNPKAQELVVKRNQLWGVLSQLRTLSNTVSDPATQSPAVMPATSIRPNSSQPSDENGTPNPDSQSSGQGAA